VKNVKARGEIVSSYVVTMVSSLSATFGP